MTPWWLEQVPSEQTQAAAAAPVKVNNGKALGTATQEEEKKDVFNLPGNDQYRIKSDLEF